jgi:predicted DNA-binding transcriptional regulator YafY
MSRSARLLALMQELRRRRRPVTADALAAVLGMSVRTIYRDIATLVEQGAPIAGEAGIGYVLKRGFFLPPLMFGADEADAVILGLRLVAARGDGELADAAEHALAKIVAVLPAAMEDAADSSGLLAAPAGDAPHLATLRHAIRAEEKLTLRYVDKKGAASARIVWPIAVGFFEAVEVLVAWCEMRTDFRHFRLDRVRQAERTGTRYPRRRRVLLAEWRAREIEAS